MELRRPPTLLLGILSAAVIVHLASIPLLGIDPLMLDARQFDAEANNLLDGKGWINTEGPGSVVATYPTQTIFLAACKFVFGRDNVTAPVVIQHLMMVAVAAMAYGITRRVGFGRVAATIALTIVAFLPHLIFFANRLVEDVAAVFWTALGFYALVRLPRHPLALIGVGVVWGIAVMARFPYQAVVPVWAVAHLVQHRREALRPAARRVTFVFIGLVLTVAPWFLHVARASGTFGGYADGWRIVYCFNREPGQRNNVPDAWQRATVMDSTMTAGERERLYRDRVFERLGEEPGLFANNMLTNFSYLLVGNSVHPTGHLTVYTSIGYAVLLGFLAVGLLGMRRGHHWRFVPAYAVAVITFGVYVPIYGYLMHALPVWVCLMPVIAHGVCRAVAGARAYREGVEGTG